MTDNQVNINGTSNTDENRDESRLHGREKDYFLIFQESRARYYRNVLKKQDVELLERINKIPDNWEEYENKNPNRLEISEEKKKRLSDIKKAKSFDINFESSHLSSLVYIENSLVSCMSCRPMTREDLAEAKESLIGIINAFDANSSNFKHLLLRLAKRSVSDLHYLAAAYHRFTRKTEYSFEKHFKPFCNDAMKILDDYGNSFDNVTEFRQFMTKLNQFFSKSSNSVGWKMDEIAVKNFLENRTENTFVFVADLKRIINLAFELKKKMKANHDYLAYYYNERDGKLFRLQFIMNSLKQKLKENRIGKEVIDCFQSTLNSFTMIKREFEVKGLEGFGFPDIVYIELLDFIIKGSKVLEFYFLRSSRYEELKEFRSELLHYVENEFYQLNPYYDKPAI